MAKNYKMIMISVTAVLLNLSVYAQNPKNIIVMIGDGMGYNHIQACNNYFGEKQEFEEWEQLWVSTYCKEGFYNSDSAYSDFNFVKRGYTDSGAAATALACGYKTHIGVIGLNENYYVVKNLTEYAEDFKKSTGVVTTVPFNHATPAGYTTHVNHRGMYHEIASQMLISSKLDVIIGCGNPNFDDNGVPVKSGNFRYIPQEMFNDIKNGEIYIRDHTGIKQEINSCDDDNSPDLWTYISSKEDFNKIAKGESLPERIFGLPEVYSTLQASRDNEKLNEDVPDLGTLSIAALNVLNRNENGFFLMIEGGAIDWASHDSSFVRTIEETYDFNNAVKEVTEWVEENSSWDETIVLITADHETGYLTNITITEDGFNKVKSKNFEITVPENNKNNSTSLKFNQGGHGYSKCDHTNQLVPLFFKGAGSEMFNKKAEYYKELNLNNDRLSNSYYIDNTDIAKVIIQLLRNN